MLELFAVLPTSVALAGKYPDRDAAKDEFRKLNDRQWTVPLRHWSKGAFPLSVNGDTTVIKATVHEKGGLRPPKAVQAQVVCGVNGEKVRPFSVPKAAYFYAAAFSIMDGVVLSAISSMRGGGVEYSAEIFNLHPLNALLRDPRALENEIRACVKDLKALNNHVVDAALTAKNYLDPVLVAEFCRLYASSEICLWSGSLEKAISTKLIDEAAFEGPIQAIRARAKAPISATASWIKARE